MSRILVIHAQYQNRGGEDIVVEQEVALLKELNEVEVFKTTNKKGIVGAVQTFLSPWNIFIAHRILQKIKAFQPDVVHIHNLHYSIGPLIIRKIKQINIPIVMTLHNYRLICPSAVLSFKGEIYLKSLNEDFPWSAVKDKVHNNSFIKTFWLAGTYWLHKKIGTWNLVQQYILFSEFAKSNFLQSNIGIDKEKFLVKANGVEDLSKVIGIKESPKLKHFLYLGRLSQEKGIIELINGVINTKFELKIAGDGPLLDHVKERIHNHPNIQLLGRIDKNRIIDEINQSTALVLPSICFEGMPLSVLESFSLSNIALVCDLGSLKTIVTNRYNGFRFNPNDIADIQSTFSKWLTLDEASKKEMRENARKDFLEKYTNEINLKSLMKIYQDVQTTSI